MSLAAWMNHNLATQGFCLRAEENRALRVGVRFSTGVCLLLVVAGLLLGSAPMLYVLAGIGLVGGTTPRHPFDLLWNHAVRHVVKAPPLPPNPPRRRHSFKIATVWLATVATLFAAGAATAGLIAGFALVAACSVVTVFNFCIPSQLMELWSRRGARHAAVG